MRELEVTDKNSNNTRSSTKTKALTFYWILQREETKREWWINIWLKIKKKRDILAMLTHTTGTLSHFTHTEHCAGVVVCNFGNTDSNNCYFHVRCVRVWGRLISNSVCTWVNECLISLICTLDSSQKHTTTFCISKS